MADTYTSNLRLRKPQINANDGVWAPLLNEMLTVAEQSVAGYYQANVTAGNATLTANNGTDDQARRMFIYATGTPGTARTITVPDTPKFYTLINDADDVVTFTRSSGGTTLALNPGAMVLAMVTSAGIFEAPLAGSYVADTLAVSQLTLDIGGTHGAGDSQTSMEYIVQGSWVFVNIEDFDAQDFSSTTFSLANNAGNWPAAIVPAGTWSVPLIIHENGVVAPASLNLSASAAAAWGIERSDAAAWLGTGTDDRILPHCISFCYPIRALA